MNIVLLMMGGSGTRFGANIPKQYILIKNKPFFSYILSKLNEVPDIDKIVIVSHHDWIDYVNEWVGRIHAEKVVKVVAGGDSRSASVLCGLQAASSFASDDDVVLIHDATHPYVDEEGMAGCIEGVKRYGAATLGALQYDTCYEKDKDGFVTGVIPRENVVSAGSPECFRFGQIYKIYSEATKEELDHMTCAGALALEHGIKMIVVPLHFINLKITYRSDMDIFKKNINTYFFENK